MKFRTEVLPEEKKGLVKYSSKIFSAGSCFAENIAKSLEDNFFSVLSNPFGTLYNPVSVFNLFEFIAGKRDLGENDVVYYDGLWHGFFQNTEFSSESKEKLLKRIKRAIKTSAEFITDTDLVILTFGTAFVYRYVKSNLTVANCHKIPQSEFERELLRTEDIFEYIRKTLEIIKEKAANGCNVILTVSPVRHLKDGAHLNNISKGNLLSAVNRAAEEFDFVWYFPAYEILLDDLRDYRFYDTDLVHPNSAALEYIREKFSVAYFDEATENFVKITGKIRKALNHRFLSENISARLNFLEREIARVKEAYEKFKTPALLRALEEFKKRKKELENSL